MKKKEDRCNEKKRRIESINPLLFFSVHRYLAVQSACEGWGRVQDAGHEGQGGCGQACRRKYSSTHIIW